MEQCDSLSSFSPFELRMLIRAGDPRIKTTTGLAYGFQQANVVVLPSLLSKDFEEFCRNNVAPLPLLYVSKPGEMTCKPLAQHADIRTDISQYCVYENGKLLKTVSSLNAYTSSLKDMVCFYLGCSFGFEGKLKEAGVPMRNVEQRKNVSMYRTSVSCVPAGVFHCPLVVTMRHVPAEMLDTVVEVTHLNPLAHGAPVHIGDPNLLGIQDLSRPNYGDAVNQQPGDVPVFWACGVTSLEAVLSSKPALAFSHSPGCMFLTDLPDSSSSSPSSVYLDPHLTPLSFKLSQSPLLYSLASKRAVHKIRQLENIIREDPGERGISAIFLKDELLLSCLALSHAFSVLITTGFPTHYMHNPPDETDGPPGAFAMANMLLSLGKRVTMVTDQRCLQLNQDIMNEAVSSGVLAAPIPLVTFEDNSPDSALNFLCHHGDITKPRYDHLVAIERSGRAADGNYYNMRGVNIKHMVDPIDNLFIAAKDIPGILTTGIGDGGNELGMGKLKERVKSRMPKGELIACDVAADYAVTCGVSNWGGYAVACGLFLLQSCSSHQRYLQKGLGLNQEKTQTQRSAALPSVDKEESFLSTLMRFGIRSGKTGNLAMEVDGMTFHPTHSDLIARLLHATHST
ncbi:D-glutamate cyclase, mitochondrial isoform X2 [Periophthalmus magnuspinnatus]|uniref:D-glutamate cyclase, mitochondrial isoform X2 n=1 Tax=Periophthalmus magnuspinnatus TaxID=409849 RepID=UPI0024366489|nr:D-glutamate cyclase, mitochondrial isoform X2 [Periophthalmus magnuspinnatus]